MTWAPLTPQLAQELVDAAQAQRVSRGSTAMVDWVCSSGHVWRAPVYARVAGNGCPQCYPVGSSYGEQQLLAAVQALDPTATHRAVIRVAAAEGERRLEVDALSGVLAVEFNGVFWHSEAAGRGASWHAEKRALLADAGLSLFTVWEDDWLDLERRAILVRGIAHRLGRSDRLHDALLAAGLDADVYQPTQTERVGARMLVPGELSGAQAAQFFRANHAQGAVSLTRVFALRDADGRVRAALGLRSPRHSSRVRRGAGEWDIQRYATCGTIPGGFTRLLAHAERTLRAEGVELEAWVTMSADESSDGELYAATGFVKAGEVRPSYWYAGGAQRGRRASKEAYQLKRFRADDALVFEEGWSEREAAAANDMYRVWDAGKTRWRKVI